VAEDGDFRGVLPKQEHERGDGLNLFRSGCRPVSLLRCAVARINAVRPTDLCLHPQQMHHSRSGHTDQADCGGNNRSCQLFSTRPGGATES
jgi:hypothetical protein